MLDPLAPRRLLERFERAVQAPRLMMLYPPVSTGRAYEREPGPGALWEGAQVAMPPFERRRGPYAARAAETGLALTPRHWRAAETVFEFHSREHVLPGSRRLAGALGSGAALDRLFPEGMRTLAPWLGLPIPQGGCRPGGV